MEKESLLLREVARKLRYRTIEAMIGQPVTITGLREISAETRALVDEHVSGCTFAGPEQKFLDGQIAKYGFLDLRFFATSTMLEKTAVGGVSLLKELGFVDRDLPKLAEELGGDAGFCLEELRDGIEQNDVHLLLFLESESPNVSDMTVMERMARLRDPSTIEFPIIFSVVDACVSNSPFVWMNKHFYM